MNGWLLLLVVCLAVIVISTIFDIEGDYVVHEEDGKSYNRRQRRNARAQKRELARMRRQR